MSRLSRLLDKHAMDNRSCQAEEIEALTAIYGDDINEIEESKGLYEIRIADELNSWWSLTLQFRFSEFYPSQSPPIFTLFTECLSAEDIHELSSHLHDLWVQNIGSSIIYTWVEALREALSVKRDLERPTWDPSTQKDVHGYPLFPYAERTNDSSLAEADHHGDTECLTEGENSCIQGEELIFRRSNQHSDADTEYTEVPEFLSGSPITDRKSTFQAHAAHVITEDQVKLALKRLKGNRKVANATHNILAYRIQGGKPNTFLQDYDDDGETHAGTRLLHLLQILEAKNVMVVVSRWYGGILLGPDRFKHINNCARKLLDEIGFSNRSDGNGKPSKNKHSNKNVSKGIQK